MPTRTPVRSLKPELITLAAPGGHVGHRMLRAVRWRSSAPICFERRDGAADRRWRTTQAARGAREAALVHHRHKYFHRIDAVHCPFKRRSNAVTLQVVGGSVEVERQLLYRGRG